MFEKITEKTFDLVYPFLEEAFPITELREKSRQKLLLEKPWYRLYGIKNADDKMQGVIAFWEIEEFVYVEHFAIGKEYRNGGFGGGQLKEFIVWLGKPVVLEVEVPEDEVTKSRVGFYERHGFVFNSYPYLQPPMRKGQDWLPLRLMSMPREIDVAEYERYKRLIHEIVYEYREG